MATELFDLSARIAVDVGQSGKALTDTQKKVVALTNELKTADKTTAKTSTTVAGLTTEAKKSEKALGEQAKEANKASRATSALGDSAKKATGGLSEFSATASVLHPQLGNAVSSVEQLGLSAGTMAGAIGLGAGAILALGGAAVSAVAGIASLAAEAAEFDGKIYDLSVRTGLTTETLSTLRLAADQSGTNIEALAKSFNILERNMFAAQTSGGDMAKIFEVLHVDTSNAEKALEQLFEQFSKMPDSVERTGLAMKIFGKSGDQVLAVIDQTGNDLGKFKEQMRDMGITVSRDGAKAADDFGDKWVEVKNRVHGISLELGRQTLPIIKFALDDLNDSLQHNKSEWLSWGNVLEAVVGGLKMEWDGLVSALKDGMDGGSMFGGVGAFLRHFGTGVEASGILMDQALKGGGQQQSMGLPGSLNALLNAKDHRFDGLLGGGGGGGAKQQTTLDKLNQVYKQLSSEIRNYGAETKEAAVAERIFQATGEKGLQVLNAKERALADLITENAKQFDITKKVTETEKELKKFLEQQVEAVERVGRGERNAYEEGEKFIANLERQGFTLQDATKFWIRHNGVLIDTSKILEKLSKIPLMLPGIMSDGAKTGLPTLDDLLKKAAENDTDPHENFMRKRLDELQQYKEALMDVKQSFVYSMMDGFSHINEGFGSMVKNMLLSFADMLTQMVIQAQMAKIAKAIFGDGDDEDSGSGGGGGFFGGLLKALLGIGSGALSSGGGSSGSGGGLTFGHEALHARAMGGPVSAGRPYIVGERGPELFMSNTSGNIVPNSQLQGMGGGNTYHFHIHGVKNPNDWNSRETQYSLKQQTRKMLESTR